MAELGIMTREELRNLFEPMGIGPEGIDGGTYGMGWHKHEALSDEVQRAMAWLSLCEKTDKFNRRTSSYTLKHECERWAGRYVSNGALLMAAHLLGFRIARVDRSPNAYINIAKKGRPQRERS